MTVGGTLYELISNVYLKKQDVSSSHLSQRGTANLSKVGLNWVPLQLQENFKCSHRTNSHRDEYKQKNHLVNMVYSVLKRSEGLILQHP